MAAIDKLYGTREQYFTLKEWLEGELLEYNEHEGLYTHDIKCIKTALRKFLVKGTYFSSPVDILAIASFPDHVDYWLLFNCPLKFVRERIIEQYNLKHELRHLICHEE